MTIRVLLCIGVTDAFFSADDAERTDLIEATKVAFADIPGQFSATVLGTFDDDVVGIGASTGFPWTSYLLMDVPSLDTVASLTDTFRQTPVGQYRMWRYYKVEARLGRALFFGEPQS